MPRIADIEKQLKSIYHYDFEYVAPYKGKHGEFAAEIFIQAYQGDCNTIWDKCKKLGISHDISIDTHGYRGTILQLIFKTDAALAIFKESLKEDYRKKTEPPVVTNHPGSTPSDILFFRGGKPATSNNKTANNNSTPIIIQSELNPGMGNAVYISGADPLLGQWQNATRMKYDLEKKAWCFTIPQGVKLTEYKFLQGPYGEEQNQQTLTNQLTWEDGDNRQLPISNSTSKSVTKKSF